MSVSVVKASCAGVNVDLWDVRAALAVLQSAEKNCLNAAAGMVPIETVRGQIQDVIESLGGELATKRIPVPR